MFTLFLNSCKALPEECASCPLVLAESLLALALFVIPSEKSRFSNAYCISVNVVSSTLFIVSLISLFLTTDGILSEINVSGTGGLSLATAYLGVSCNDF